MAVKPKMQPRLTLGPVLFNWLPEKWRDFYFRMADEAPIDIVYIGEVVCSKRAPFFEALIPDILERLNKAGKAVVISSLAMVMNKREVNATRDIATDAAITIEVNDVSALSRLGGRPHVIGPYMNVYNEGTLMHLAKNGAQRFCLPPELPFSSLQVLAAAAKGIGAEIEIQIFGRMPLALSSRCYHARAHKLTKDNCQFVCNKDPDGMLLRTLDDQPFLAVNGIQTLSDKYVELAPELELMKEVGIDHFRLSPHDCDMVAVSRLYRGTLDRKISPLEVSQKLREQLPDIRFSNGYFYKQAGHQFIKEMVS